MSLLALYKHIYKLTVFGRSDILSESKCYIIPENNLPTYPLATIIIGKQLLFKRTSINVLYKLLYE
jgi:hypothetical protein